MLSTYPRIYWATIKRRNPELIAICKQLKLTVKDGKKYLTDVIDDGLNLLVAILLSKKSDVFLKWVKTKGTSIDEQSKTTIFNFKNTKGEKNLAFCVLIYKLKFSKRGER